MCKIFMAVVSVEEGVVYFCEWVSDGHDCLRVTVRKCQGVVWCWWQSAVWHYEFWRLLQ